MRYEVLVCDDGSRDATAEMCRNWAASYPVPLRFLAGEHSGGPSGPRNSGTLAAQGHLVAFLDDDVVPAPDFVQQHTAFHRRYPEPHCAAVARLVIPEHERDNPMLIFSDFPYHEMEGQDRLGFLYFWTGNFSLKRDFMRRHGMFRPDPSLYPIEDMDCGHRLTQAGMHLRYLPEAIGYHYPTVRPESVAKRGYRTGMAQFALWNMIRDPWIPQRFGVLTPEIGAALYAERALKRLLLLAVDQPLTHAVLRALGAANGRRSRWSDLYYYLIFRRHMIHGYRAAQLRHAQGAAPSPVPVPRFDQAESYS